MKIKTKINKWDLIKLKSFCMEKETINKMKNNPQNGRNYLPMKKPTGDQSPKYTNSSHSSMSRKQTTQSKKWAIDISPKKTYRWPIGS